MNIILKRQVVVKYLNWIYVEHKILLSLQQAVLLFIHFLKIEYTLNIGDTWTSNKRSKGYAKQKRLRTADLRHLQLLGVHAEL